MLARFGYNAMFKASKSYGLRTLSTSVNKIVNSVEEVFNLLLI